MWPNSLLSRRVLPLANGSSERMGCLSGDWFVEGVDVRKREELQMVGLMAKLGDGIRLMLRPEWVDGVKLQMIWGLGVKSALVLPEEQDQEPGGGWGLQ